MSFVAKGDEEWRVVPSRSNRPPAQSESSATEPKETKSHHRPSREKCRVVSQEREERTKENGTNQRFVSQGGRERDHSSPNDATPSVVRLLRRPARNKVAESDPPSQTTSSTVVDTFDRSLSKPECSVDDMRQKIGAPIIRPLAMSDFSTRAHHRRQEDEQTGATGQTRISDLDAAEQSMFAVQLSADNVQSQLRSSRFISGLPGYELGRGGDREKEHHRGGLLMLAKKEVEPKPPSPPPTFDLSSDSQWPSIAGVTTSGSGSGQRVWLSEMEGKGWNSIVKSAPSVKPAVKREAVSPHSTERSREEEESPVNSGETKKRQRKKKKKSGEGVAQPQSPREKKLNTSLLLDLSQYMNQAPVRPVLNTKDTKASKEAPGATGNVLDSTAPSVRRGKEREAPKPKKPTQLRKIIELEKAAKKQLREQGLSIPPDLDVMKGENEQSGNRVEVDPMLQTTPTSQLVTQTTPTFELMSQTTPIFQPMTQTTSTSQPMAQTTPTTQPVSQTTPISQPAKQLHNKKFREYCSHMVTEEINSVVELLLQELVRFQDRQHLRDPVRAKSKRRYVCGLREVCKHLGLGKLKCVIIPPNLDHIQSTGGIDERVSTILSLCHEREVQVVYAMSRRRLAAVLRKKFKMGCVGIFSYDGAEVHYKKLMRLVEEATEQYQQVALLQTGGEAKETFSTTHDPQTSDSDNSSIGDGVEDDERSVPDPGNTSVTGAEVMETPWKIFFKQSPHDITGSRNERAEDGKNDELQTVLSSGGGVECLTNQNSENDSDVTTVNHLTTKDTSDVDVSKKATTFHWNVNATEFKP